ncbi:MDR family MFS transporter [Streptomyces sp. AM 3-1-1]|uniref:MDR family MFS transporter n=1 Tax=Streptomyces sp. AM 3-1-1 TaxID=3028711 RepID=UPI0023B9D96C|nr:MDR family MFS transporter [Streptomyces sp. AM 3-1-1]WEH29140.1 MDR family MFS transporter [Streptomyces sp. AM 3-1-1]
MSATVSGTPPNPPRAVRWVLLGVMLAMLLSMLDNMVVSTAMPTIVADLGGLSSLSWVVTAYTLVTAVSTPVWGKFGDLFGRKRTYLASIAVFVIGSALCGAAGSMGALIAFRVVQGIGAGGIGAGAFALIAALVPPRERGKYQGMTASVMAIGIIGGPLLGGFVTDHLSWRWAFYINLPLGLLTLVWLQAMLRLPERRIKAKIDWPGIVLLGAFISSVVLGTTWGGDRYAWGSWQTIGLGLAAVVSLLGFLAVERRVGEPLLPPRVFTGHRNFPVAVGILFVVGVVTFGAGLYLPLFQQTVQGASASHSGLLMLPMMLPVVVVSTIAGKVMSATGRYRLFPIVGAALMAIGLGLLATMDADTSRLLTALYMIVLGAGMGLCMQMAGTIAQNAVELRDIGAASSSINLFRTMGGSIGVAVFSTLFNHALSSHTDHIQGFTAGTQTIFTVAAVLCALACAAALLIIEVPLRKAGSPPKPTTPTPDDQPATA